MEDVRWLLRYLGAVTEAQIRQGLIHSGATAAECDCFVAALVNRIHQLRRVSTDKFTRLFRP